MLQKLFKKLVSFRKNRKKRQLFEIEFKNFQRLNKRDTMPVSWSERKPMLHDKTSVTDFNSHYIFHPAWAARIIRTINPTKHVDISSTLHFCSMISAFLPVEFYDFRPADLKLDNLISGEADLTNLFFSDNSIDCLSCMHTLEHIGLGRYGDKLDPNGDLKAINELQRVAKEHLLIVVPVGRQRVVFNAHRVYDANTFIGYFDQCQLQSFAMIDDEGKFEMDADPDFSITQNYACGCFYFKKNKIV